MNGYSDVEILYAEDSAADAEMTMRAFKRYGLVNPVVWVKDGAEALDYLFRRGAFEDRPNGHQPRLLLIDLKMPRVDGIEVLRQVKSTPEIAHLPVVMLTSSAEESDIVASYGLGVNSYIVKPVEFDRFMDEVAKVGFYWAIQNKTMIKP